jgi:hypothetical protein
MNSKGLTSFWHKVNGTVAATGCARGKQWPETKRARSVSQCDVQYAVNMHRTQH